MDGGRTLLQSGAHGNAYRTTQSERYFDTTFIDVACR
jgi:hypothetical protein